ncbi:MAG: TolB family protein, partial [Planctomycetota bacterium]|jgi:TolB protein
MAADGTEQVRITPGPSNTDYYTARWSPDGRYIAFWSQQGPVVTIHRADADGTGLIDLTDVQARNERASWTPDSQHIVFATNRHGDDGSIYIMNADGSYQTRLTNDPVWDRDPVVRPSG